MSPSRNLGDLVDRSADPSKAALVDLSGARPRTYAHGELDGLARAVARGLVRAGHRRGDRIGILSANRAEFLAAYLGTMRAGLVSVPVSFKFPPETVAYVLEDAGVVRVFADAERRALVPAGLPTVLLDEPAWSAFTDPGDFETVAPSPGEVAMFLYTSGSTGRPKGVPLTHAGQWWPIQHRLAAVADLGRHRFLVAAPLYHMNALGQSKLALAAHATVVLLPQFRAQSYIEAIGRHRCTWLTSVPTMMALVARENVAPRADRPVVGRARGHGIGAAHPGPGGPGARGVPPRRAHQRLRDHRDGAHRLRAPPARSAASGPVPRLPRGRSPPAAGKRRRPERGRRRAGASHARAMPGYHNLPSHTAKVMTDDGYYVTGDVFRRDASGFYYFVGRADDMFVCGGENIHPGEVETVLERHPGVAQACVVPVDDEIRGQKPVAFVVATPGAASPSRT